MKNIKRTAAIFTAAALTTAAAVPVMAAGDPITDLYTYQTQSAEMETFNILNSQMTKELDVLTNCIDGLLEADEYGKLVPGIAESWETTDDGVTWTFHLREGVKWVDASGNELGEVTAQDFVTGLEWVLNYYKNEAANTSMPCELIEGAQEYYDYTEGLSEEEAKALTADNEEFEKVGIEAVDDYTLVYTCVGEKPYFDTVATYNCLYPLPQGEVDELGVDGIQAIQPDQIWYNGAYTITTYVQNNEKVLTKNPLYWDTECTRFDTVTIKMVESQDVAYQLYETGEIDNITLTESNLSTIYSDESNEFHDQLVEMQPTKYSYQLHFNYNKLDSDGNPDTDWNTAAANEAFRLSWYYGLEFGDFYKRYDAINPYKCYNNAYTMKGLVYLSDGTEYTDVVLDKLGIDGYDGESMTRFDADKAEQYKQQAIEELTAQGVTFPIHAAYYIQGGNQTALDTATVLQQTFSDCLGDDYVVLDIYEYVNSLTQEVLNPRLLSFGIMGWGADYGDPQNYLSQEVLDNDNAFHAVRLSHPGDSTSEELIALYQEFTDRVADANAINDDLDARYEAYADAEVFFIEHALAIPVYFNIQWQLTHVNDYSKINAMFGIQNGKYKNWETSKEAYTTEEYEAFAEAYEAGSAE